MQCKKVGEIAAWYKCYVSRINKNMYAPGGGGGVGGGVGSLGGGGGVSIAFLILSRNDEPFFSTFFSLMVPGLWGNFFDFPADKRNKIVQDILAEPARPACRKKKQITAAPQF